MKAHWLKVFFILTIMLTIAYQSYSESKVLSRKEALIVAEKTPEVEALYQVNNGKLEYCIEKEVIKPCDTDWVTCIDDAWVVQFNVGDICPIEHDGRLGVTLLVDGITGMVLSRFPEFPYFEHKDYCLEDYDCLSVTNQNNEENCLNFIFGQLDNAIEIDTTKCFCVESKCQNKQT